MTDTTPLDPGTTIGGHYVIDGLINRGGFGAVYRGIDSSEGNRLCAIKETYDVTPAARRRALMEAAVLFTVKRTDRKSTRLNSSHSQISYAVFCLKKKKNHRTNTLHDII